MESYEIKYRRPGRPDDREGIGTECCVASLFCTVHLWSDTVNCKDICALLEICIPL